MLFLYVRQNSLLGTPIILYAAPFLGCPIQPNVIFLWAYFCNHAALFIVPINSKICFEFSDNINFICKNIPKIKNCNFSRTQKVTMCLNVSLSRSQKKQAFPILT